MDIKKRLFRKPVTTALWGILVMAMALLLGVGAALMFSSGSLAKVLDGYYTSIAVRTDKAVTSVEKEYGVSYNFESKALFQKDVDYLESLEGVEGVYFHTLTAGYSPSFQPIIDVAGGIHNSNDTYDDAMIIGTVTRMTEPVIYDYDEDYWDLSPIGGPADAREYTVTVEVKIEEFVCGNNDYTLWGKAQSDGYVNVKMLMFSGMGDGMIREGGRYIFYGAYGRNRYLISEPTLLEDSGHPWLYNYGYMILKNNSLYCVNGLGFELQEDGSYETVGTGVNVPSIAPISGTLEEFLADPQNADWVTSIENQQIAHHSVPVLGTEALDTIYAFVNNDANMVEGRGFTREEYDSGARVCVISESLALKSGISVGDTISLSQYLCHEGESTGGNFSVDVTDTDGKLNNPAVGEYEPGTPFLTRDEEFTVVGLYRLMNEWSDTSYSFTPNTVFIPQKAQPAGGFGGMSAEVEVTEYWDGSPVTYTQMEEGGCFGIYLTMKLKNGKVKAFEQALEESKFAGQFITIDQGFDKIQESLEAISAGAVKLLAVVVAGWLVLLCLYLLLYQGMQRKNVGIMRALGAAPEIARSYLFGSGFCVAAGGIALGTALTGAAMGLVRSKLFESAFGPDMSKYSGGVALSRDALNEMVVGSQLPGWVILVIAAAQLGIFAAALWIQAQRMSRRSPRALLSK